MIKITAISEPSDLKVFCSKGLMAVVIGAVIALSGCSSTEVIESPKTGFVSESTPAHDPKVIWTSRTFIQPFEYLGQVKVRSWTYNGAVDRLIDAGKSLRADAIIDIHYEEVGFLSTMQAFAVKYK